jgi:hypothetical protein
LAGKNNHSSILDGNLAVKISNPWNIRKQGNIPDCACLSFRRIRGLLQFFIFDILKALDMSGVYSRGLVASIMELKLSIAW